MSLGNFGGAASPKIPPIPLGAGGLHIQGGYKPTSQITKEIWRAIRKIPIVLTEKLPKGNGFMSNWGGLQPPIQGHQNNFQSEGAWSLRMKKSSGKNSETWYFLNNWGANFPLSPGFDASAITPSPMLMLLGPMTRKLLFSFSTHKIPGILEGMDSMCHTVHSKIIPGNIKNERLTNYFIPPTPHTILCIVYLSTYITISFCSYLFSYSLHMFQQIWGRCIALPRTLLFSQPITNT